MASTVVITFNSNPQSNDNFSLQDSLTPTATILVVYNLLNSILGGTISQTIQLTTAFLNNNYNATNLYTITNDLVAGTITITANNNNSEFSLTQNNTDGRISFNISNTPPPFVFDITSVTISEADSTPCNNVKLTATCNAQATTITSPITQSVTTNPFVFDTLRSATVIKVTMNDANNPDSFDLFVPVLVAADFTVNVSLTPGGGNVIVNNNYFVIPFFALEYSINNVDFFSSNSFSGLAVGSHTVYIRDNIGCSISINFDIDAFTPNVVERKPLAFVSNLNAFRFKIVEDFTTNIKTPFNTLSFEENVQTPIGNYRQPFEIGDGTITTQIKSTYQTHSAFLIDKSDDSETPLMVEKKTSNTDITDVRDGTVRQTSYLSLNYVGVTYGSGNTYDPVTLVDNGDYNLGNNLPDWVNIDDYLNVQGAGWYRVIDIITVDNLQTAVLNVLVSNFALAVPQNGLSRQITSIYNLLDFEIYEFDVDLSVLNGNYQVRIQFEDTEFTNVTNLSECINVAQTQPCTHLVQWYSIENNEINFSTGIRPKARFEYIYNLPWSPADTQEVFDADTRSILLRAIVRERYTMMLKPIPMLMAQKIMLIMANNRVFIDTLSVIKAVEAEAPNIQSTNLYTVTQELIRSDYVFDSGAEEGSNVDPLAVDQNGEELLFIN